MDVRHALLAAAGQVPWLRRLLDAREQLGDERERFAAERQSLIAGRDDLRRQVDRLEQLNRFVPPGHFYSPIPALDDIVRDQARLFPSPPPRTLPGIDLREAEQLALLAECVPFYAELPFTPQPSPGLRYHFENGAYSYADAIFLYAMLRRLRPRRVIEIGSGYSSCVTLDTNAMFLGNTAETTFIDPYPELLQSLLQPGDAGRIRILPDRLQDVPLELFATLGAGDILFIDSTHVAKIGSDVITVFDRILPSLQPGVVVHFHDIFYPFEYPRYWLEEGRAWNEAYMLRAFLQYNAAFDIEIWNHFLWTFHRPLLLEQMPLCDRNPGASVWLRVKQR